MINLNTLPLGDMPDSGWITLPGDKVTIRDRVIIHETSENGKKVVKLYRQDNVPQQIQSAAQQYNGKQSKKRAASPNSNRTSRKRQISSTGAGPQLTAEQEFRRIEINKESKRIGAENNAINQEYAAIKLLMSQNPLDPEIARRTALNRSRASEINRRGRENGDRRRALKLELNTDIGDYGKEGQMNALGNLDDSFNDSHATTHNSFFNEHKLGPDRFAYNGASHSFVPAIQDPYRQSYAAAPGYQNHSPSFQTNPIPYANANDDPLPENKIHPARLSLMNSNAQMPERYSTEPKVLMKVTGENMVPVVKSRMASRNSKAPINHERDISGRVEAQEWLLGGKTGHLNSCNAHERHFSPLRKEFLANRSLPPMQDKEFKSEEATAWLDANISLEGASASGASVLGELNRPLMHDDQTNQEEMEPRRVHRSVEQTRELKVLTLLGLQCYHDESEDTASDDEIPQAVLTPVAGEVCLENTNIKEEPIDDHALTQDQGLDASIKGELITSHSVPSRQSHVGNIIIKQESHFEYQNSITRIQKENLATKSEPEEHDKPLWLIVNSAEVVQEVVECVDKRSPRKPGLGERSVNAVVTAREEIGKEME